VSLDLSTSINVLLSVCDDLPVVIADFFYSYFDAT